VKVLFVNHTAEVSGGERSLLDLAGALPPTIDPLLATPRGTLAERADEIGLATTSIPGTNGSLKLHPLRTPRALGELAAAAAGLRLAARRHAPALVHANSIRAGAILGLSRAPGVKVVHVRDCLPQTQLSVKTMRLIASTATVVVANSEYTARSVRALAPEARLEVVHNPVDLKRWDPSRIDRVHARAKMEAVRPRSMLLGVVAQLTPWKGQDTAIEALRLLRDQGVDAHLLLIGSAKFVSPSTRHDNAAYVTELRQRIASAKLEDRVSWLGEREDVPELVSALDALLLPSWEEPFGRAATEAMALGVPVLATEVGGPAEIITDGLEGYLLDPRDPAAWAKSIRRLARDSRLGREMGLAGRRRVEEDFTLDQHVAAIVDVYRRAIARPAI
jgi:glycosyltransferase involved in cell wall biosynthesis